MEEQNKPQDTIVPTSERVKTLNRLSAKGVIPVYSKNKEGRWIYSYMRKADAVAYGFSISEIRLAGNIYDIGEI